MDIRDISQVFIAKDCVRTNGADTIDGNAVTGVQIYTATEDDLSAAETYYGNGEMVITDASGLVLTAATALKSVPEIVIHQRSHNGLNTYRSNPIKGSEIVSYTFTPYTAPSEQVVVIHTIDATLLDYLYIVKLVRATSDKMHVTNGQEVRTVTFKSAVAGSTATQIATGLALAINTQLANDGDFQVTAVVGGAASDAVIITASPMKWVEGKFNYDQLRFSVEGLNFDATVVNNTGADLTYNLITYPAVTKGAGTYKQVAEMEAFGKLFTGANKDVLQPLHTRNIVALDYQKYQTDGVTINSYDTIVIGWEHSEGAWSQNVSQRGHVILFLPVEDNATSQALDIVNTLNKYIVTEWGVGTAITLT